jgi:hypothetical protein
VLIHEKKQDQKSHATTFMQTLSNVESSCLVQKPKMKRKISSTVSVLDSERPDISGPIRSIKMYS